MSPKDKKQDTYNYKGWLHSDSFLKRAFAVWGHFITAHLIIIFGVMISVGIIFLLIALLGWLVK
ncbi:hypothetical protein HYY69_03760 [Candidatus Woesearchaeota archaeon]|nr:hypothetical protein [Candidatus Woesearchaeota archaeon]